MTIMRTGQKITNMFKQVNIIKTTGVLFLLIGIGLAFLYIYPADWFFTKFIHETYANFSAEFISIAITILLINYLYDLKENLNVKRRLIRELASEEKGISSNALLELKEKGWLQDGSLKNIKLTNTNLSNQDLTGADLEGVFLDNADLTNAILKNVNLNNASLCKTILSNANLECASLNNSIIHSAQFYEAKLNKIEAINVDFMNSNMRLAQLSDCKFDDCKFEDVDFELSNLTDSKFKECNLLRVNLHSTNIKGAVFERCDLNSIRNWRELVKRSTESFLAPSNPPVDFLTFKKDQDE